MELIYNDSVVIFAKLPPLTYRYHPNLDVSSNISYVSLSSDVGL